MAEKMRIRRLKSRLRKKIGPQGRLDSRGQLVFVATCFWRGEYRECRAICRIDAYEESVRYENDVIMDQSGCLGDFMRDWRIKDINQGCPKCGGCYE